jgi:phosphocarrier protein HPr
MPEIKMIIQHQVGLHARPASLFVQTAKQFKSAIKVTYGARTANAKSILSVLALGAGQGAELDIQADGEDASAALQAIESLIAGNFGAAT